MKAFWFWLVPVVAAICLALSLWAWIGVLTETYSWTSTFPAVINGLFIVLGVAISLAVDFFLLRRRDPRALRVPEIVLLLVVIALTVVSIWIGFYDEASWATLFLWPILILVAIALTVVIAVGNAGTKEPVAPPSPFDQPPAVR